MNNNILTEVNIPIILGNITNKGRRAAIVGFYNDQVMVDGDNIYLSVYGETTAAILNGKKYLATDYGIMRPTISAFFNCTCAADTHKAIKEGKIHVVPFTRPARMYRTLISKYTTD